jgi:GT2 family glycosyltransferase
VAVVCPELTDFDGSLIQLTRQWRVNLCGEFLNKLFSPQSMARSKLIRELASLLQKNERSVSWVSGAAFIVKREVMEKLNGFDENYQFYYEDADLFERIHSTGLGILFVPSIKVCHSLGQSTKKENRKIYLMFIQSRLYYYRKHLSRIQFHLLRIFLKMKFFISEEYRTGTEIRQWLDYILDQKGIIRLWQDIQL